MDARRGAGTRDDARVVAGRYTLLEPLGSGGMGTVWRARDDVLGRDVAIKEVVFPPGISDRDRDVLRERTRREARAAAGLHHPGAVTVYDVVQDGDAPFLVMELVRARTLADVVRDSGPLSPQRAAQVGLAVLGALEAAHRQGIVHRDVKPSNVLICDGADAASIGRVVLTDFGIASSAGDSSITSTGLLLGSPSYIAPERARGQQPAPASDLWSLGATLFTAVEGRPPFDAGEPLLTVAAVATGEPAAFAEAGPLEPVIAGLLERDPDRRLDAAAASRMLEQVARGPAAAPRSLPAPTPSPTAAPAHDGKAVLVGAVRREVDATSAETPPDDAPAPAGSVDPAPADDAAPAFLAGALRPARPAAAPRRRSWSIPLALTALVLLGTLVAVAALLRGGDAGTTAGPQTSGETTVAEDVAEEPAADGAGEQDARTGDGLPPEQPGQDPSGDGTSAEQVPPAEGTRAEQAPPPAAQPAADGPLPAPAGWREFTGGPGWTAAVPPSYAQGSFKGAPEYRDNATGRTLRISTTGPGGGKDDAVQDRREQAASFAQRHEDYREIEITPIDYRGYEAADWEFTYRSGNASLHALSRVFVVDGRGYSLYFQTRASDDWAAARAEFERISQSFRPA